MNENRLRSLQEFIFSEADPSKIIRSYVYEDAKTI